MSEPDFISSSRIAIIGLGLMGGSLALALRDRCQTLLGCDQDPAVLEYAHQLNLFAKLSGDPAEVLAPADVVILATPINNILEIIKQLPDLHPGSPIVLDLGSTKTGVVQAYESLPSRFDPLGGHPMCGKEVTGFGNAEVELFQGAAFVFTPLERTSNAARSLAEQLAFTIGAHALWLDPETHDKWSAATSHLPYLVASALAGSTPADARPLAGPGFRSTTRVAATSSSIMLGILETNQENVLEQIVKFRDVLDNFEQLLSFGEYGALESALDESASKQRELAGSQEDR
jgi:prephenate dehydrogenase